MDIALDANDVTRQGMPGEEFLMQRARCSKATFYRRMELLRSGGLLKVVRRGGGRSGAAIYEIPPLLVPSSRCSKPFESGLTNAETQTGEVFEQWPP